MAENQDPANMTRKRRPPDGIVEVYRRPYLPVEFPIDTNLMSALNDYYEKGYVVAQMTSVPEPSGSSSHRRILILFMKEINEGAING